MDAAITEFGSVARQTTVDRHATDVRRPNARDLALLFEPDNNLLLDSIRRAFEAGTETDADTASSEGAEAIDRERQVFLDFAECWPGIQ
jgi:hypothetical protein